MVARILKLFQKPDSETSSDASFMRSVLEKLGAQHRIFWGDRMLTMDKSAGFMEKPEFAKTYAKLHEAHIYDQYGSPSTIAWRLHTLIWAAENALSLPGDFVECGVFRGDMSWSILECTKFKESGKRFYLYDSFEGFSDKYTSADDYPDNPGFLSVAQEAYREKGLYDYVSNRFSPYPNVRVIKGVVPDVLPATMPEKISYLHIDLNSPKAEIGALELLFDRVVPGGTIVFDDYGWHIFRKQKEAEDTFMTARGHSILELPTGQGLVIKKPNQ